MSNERSSPESATAIAMIDRRLEDLAEANAIYGKDQRLNAPDKIARNEREISWLKDLRSELVLRGHAQCQQQWQPIETVPKDHEVEVRGLWKLRGDGVEFTHWRPSGLARAARSRTPQETASE